MKNEEMYESSHNHINDNNCGYLIPGSVAETMSSESSVNPEMTQTLAFPFQKKRKLKVGSHTYATELGLFSFTLLALSFIMSPALAQP